MGLCFLCGSSLDSVKNHRCDNSCGSSQLSNCVRTRRRRGGCQGLSAMVRFALVACLVVLHFGLSKGFTHHAHGFALLQQKGRHASLPSDGSLHLRALPLLKRWPSSLRRSTSMSTDFDSVRTSLRTIISTTVSIGSIFAIGALFVSGLRGGSKDVALNAENFMKWARTVSPDEWKKLLWCVGLDIAGVMPEILLPGPLGEYVDVLWAPVYAFLLFQTFGGRPFLYKTVLAAVGFLEEAIPFTDFLPSATIGWFLESSSDSLRRELLSGAVGKIADLKRVEESPGGRGKGQGSTEKQEGR